MQENRSPDQRPHPSQSLAWVGIFVPLSFTLLAVATPYLFTHSYLYVALILQRGFSLVCHQRPERSLVLFGAHVAVCARCLGLYVGAAIGAVVVFQRRMALSLLLLAAALNLADVIGEAANLHGNWMALRLALGMLLGFAAAAWVRASAHSPVAEQTRA